jgi:hypothetical protein
MPLMWSSETPTETSKLRFENVFKQIVDLMCPINRIEAVNKQVNV